MIDVKGVCLRFPNGTTALNNIDLQVKAGDMVYVTGPSGSGKTSLLEILMGIEYPTTGSATVLGQLISKGQTAGIRQMRRLVGPIFQDFKLIEGRTAVENVMLGMRFLDISRDQLKENARKALKRVGLEHKELSLVENLSLGESQRVAIARAVARKPILILADEPTGNLDQDNAMRILMLLSSFIDHRTAVIITTHATHLIKAEKNTRLIRMENGSLVWERLDNSR